MTFSPKIDLALAVTLGAVDGDLELGGLRLTDLRLEAGASRATVRFSQPNATRCRAATLTAGAAELSVLGLGNSRCDRITFEGGMGRVTLDFGGAWTSQLGGRGEDGARRGCAAPAAYGRQCGSRSTSSSPASSRREWCGAEPAICPPATTRRPAISTST